MLGMASVGRSHQQPGKSGNKNCNLEQVLQRWVEWLTYLPGLLCIAGNIFFFLNIFRWIKSAHTNFGQLYTTNDRILLTKLRAPHANEPTNFR